MSTDRNTISGHLCALFAATNWGFTFVLSNLLLLAGLTAFEALLLRCLVAYLFLWLICPHRPHAAKKTPMDKTTLLSSGNTTSPNCNPEQPAKTGRLKTILQFEWPYIAAGLSGLSIYYLLDYTALNYTSASMVTVLCGTVPLFVTLALWLVHQERPSRLFFLGFAVSISGVALIATAGGAALQVSFI
ncbi:MAG: DMT family transporter, partial [Coriobacteriia bacterium]|nr:DMT family transporter [Coriobacteriia bacterium]